MQRPYFWLFVLAALACVAIIVINSGLPLFRHIGEVESLKSPVVISGWSAGGLQTVDGRTIPIPHITHLPATSPSLSEATKRGIEIAPDGQITTLVYVYY